MTAIAGSVTSPWSNAYELARNNIDSRIRYSTPVIMQEIEVDKSEKSAKSNAATFAFMAASTAGSLLLGYASGDATSLVLTAMAATGMVVYANRWIRGEMVAHKARGVLNQMWAMGRAAHNLNDEAKRYYRAS